MNERRSRAILKERSGSVCEIDGCGVATDWHHRKNRSQGGLWTPANGLHLAAPCHRWVTENPLAAVGHGWSVLSWQDPLDVPVRLHYGLHKLTDDGGVIPLPDPCPAGCAVWTPDNECDCQEAS